MTLEQRIKLLQEEAEKNPSRASTIELQLRCLRLGIAARDKKYGKQYTSFQKTVNQTNDPLVKSVEQNLF